MKQLLLFLLLFTAIQSFAQEQNRIYKKKPVWVDMMDDENVNYYEALKAYDTFWQYHEKPENEEGDWMPEGKDYFQEKEKKRSKRQLKELQMLEELRYEVKRFEFWKRESEPYVQEDGSILSMDERIKIWQNAKNQ